MATNNNKYGNLLDKYMDDKHVDYGTKIKREIEAKDRYGGLLDNVKPNYKLHEDMINVDNMCRQIRQQRADEYERENRRRQERIDKNNAFVNSYLEKKEAEQKALWETAEQKRKKLKENRNSLIIFKE